MVRGVPGSRPRLEAEHLSPDDVNVLLRDGNELAPEPIEVVPVQTARACIEAGRVDEVGRSDLAHVHLEPWIPVDESAGCPGVVQVDVRQHEMAEVFNPEPLLGEALFEPAEAGGRPAVDERRLVVREEIGRDHPRAPEVLQVDQDRRQAS